MCRSLSAGVGDRQYWENWSGEIAKIAQAHTERISALVFDNPSAEVDREFARFVTALKANLNDGVTDADAVSMLSQHVITKPVFDALFEGYDFAAHNPVSAVMDTMVEVLEGNNLRAETDELEGFYVSVAKRADGIDNAVCKQRIITELYENFFKKAFPKQSEALGIVYTPIEIVDFILRSVDHLSKEHFGKGLSDEGGHVLEPALGSGAFAIEAVRQLAEEYLTRREEELDYRIPAEERPTELQKVKAHIALHQVYGVDLNDTAVELAEISLWLDTMSTDLQAPWFGLRLKQGNSLLGARRASYTRAQVNRKEYLKVAPTDHPLTSMAEAMADERQDDALLGRIHHFLLPAEGWGAAASVKEVKDLAGENQKKLRDWQRQISTKLTKDQVEVLLRLANRVETLWPMALRRLQVAEAEAQRNIEYFGKEVRRDAMAGKAVSREDIERKLGDPNGIYRRLKLVMDLWSALWFWPVVPNEEQQPQPPTIEQWLAALQMILGTGQTMVETRKQAPGQGDLLASGSWEDLNKAESIERAATNMRVLDEIIAEFPWVTVGQQIANQQNFYHWELEFGTVFARGGFDLQVGNPPWVRPTSDIEATLAEYDPWWQLAHKPSQQQKRTRRELTLDLASAKAEYVAQISVNPITASWIGSSTQYPLLKGQQADLYRGFMVRSWASAAEDGVVGLVHPISHLTEKRANLLRKETYRRICRLWHFTNALRLYEIHSAVNYGFHIYNRPEKQYPHFLMASFLYHPDTLVGSLKHDGSGPVPGLRDEYHHWDIRPHRQRIQSIDITALSTWASILEDPDTPVMETRALFLPNAVNAGVLDKLVGKARIRELGWQGSGGWHETGGRKKGHFEVESNVPETWNEVLIQGPHFGVATPLIKQPRPSMRSSTDYEELDLEVLPTTFIPRTNYRTFPGESFNSDYTVWESSGTLTSARNFYRLIWRRRASNENERTLIPALVPPGTTHVDSVFAGGPFEDPSDIYFYLGLFSSLPYDFVVRASGASDIRLDLVGALPSLHDIDRQIRV